MAQDTTAPTAANIELLVSDEGAVALVFDEIPSPPVEAVEIMRDRHLLLTREGGSVDRLDIPVHETLLPEVMAAREALIVTLLDRGDAAPPEQLDEYVVPLHPAASEDAGDMR